MKTHKIVKVKSRQLAEGGSYKHFCSQCDKRVYYTFKGEARHFPKGKK